MTILGERVTALRIQLNMNQEKLAKESELTQPTISRIERGEIKELKSEALIGLAKALRTTVDYLLGRTDKAVPDDAEIHDSDAKYIFRGWEKLSPEGRKRVREFFEYIEKTHKRRDKK